MFISSGSQEIVEAIKTQTWDSFNTAYSKKYKKPYERSLFTVLASVYLVNSSNRTLHCTSIAFGTKSLPSSVMKDSDKGDLLCDMHAQILAIQGFRQFLLKEIETKNSRFLEWNEKKKKYSISKNFGVYLYCSEIFCGDCCIDQQQDSFSGAKPLKYLKYQQYPEQKYQQNILRTKPGRIDLPVSKRSPILSCSDQIGFFNLVGIQGKELVSLVTPIYLHTVIVEGPSSLRKSIERGINLIERLMQLTKKSWMLISRQIFNIVIKGKERQISSQFYHNTPNLIILSKQNQEIGSRDQEGFELCGIISQLTYQCEWINGRTGLPEGSSLNNYKKKGKISQFSQNKLKEEFDNYRDGKDTFKYQAVEERLKILFKQWL